MKIDHSKFSESRMQFKKATEKRRFGYCLWEFYDPSQRFVLECWEIATVSTTEKVIFQIWADGNGFSPYVYKNFDKILKS